MEFALPILVTGAVLYLCFSSQSTPSEGTMTCYPTCKAMPVTIMDQIKDSLAHPPGGMPYPLNRFWWEVTQCDYAMKRLSARLEYVEDVQRRDLLLALGIKAEHKAIVRTMMLTWQIVEQTGTQDFTVHMNWSAAHSSEKLSCDHIARTMQLLTEENILKLNTLLSAKTYKAPAGKSSLHSRFGGTTQQQGKLRSAVSSHSAQQAPVAKRSSWPSPQDFNEAIQDARTAFDDKALQQGEAELNMMGMPKVASGTFASVYKLQCPERNWAVRCFLNPAKDRQYRYEQLSKYIGSDTLSSTVDFEYVNRGIRVGADFYPVLKMEWVEGVPFHLYIEEALRRTDNLLPLINEFRTMAESLHYAGIAHGDLQHGNIMVKDNHLVLVDYDGMFVPSLSMERSNEIGHPNYQHPSRDKNHFGAYLDNFSTWLIDTSLVALHHDPDLWSKFNGGDECLLFRRRDLVDPAKSQLFTCLQEHSRIEVRTRTEHLLNALTTNPASIPAMAADGSDLPPVQSSAETISRQQKLLPDWLDDVNA
ncbi:MAG: hypothetical protein K2W95_17085 [Candidatus Obscuribacterales bacterium]|nr:hypothetical protein [Candidatus Obscuribacterales bacterium]